jgi:hypothetical protein
MKIITFIYIFALYALFIPGVCFKQNKLLHGVLFSFCLYFTYDIINNNVENYEATLQVNGMENVSDLIKKQENQSSKTVTINNKIRELPKKYYDNENSDGSLLSTSYKMIDTLKDKNDNLTQTLKAYKGDDDKIDELKGKMDSYKNQIIDLKTQLNSYKGTDASGDKLNALVNKLQSEIYTLNIQLANSKQKTQ